MDTIQLPTELREFLQLLNENHVEVNPCPILPPTSVPFKPTQGRPVLCRQCFQTKRAPTTGALLTAAATAEMVAGASAEQVGVSAELLAAAQATQA